MMIPIFVMRSVGGGPFVPFFVKSIGLKSLSWLQRLTHRWFAPPAVSKNGEVHEEELIIEEAHRIKSQRLGTGTFP
jgi:hypothetical protein